MGEVLIFMNIARYFPDRPVYALRARGFDDEPYFNSMAELVSVYHAGIKRHHPSGPYALAGYSFGSFPAHEIAKAMEAAGDKVEFMAVLDQAPFQKTRAAGYDWVSIVLSLAFFLGLMDEKKAMDLVPNLRMMNDHEAVLDYILAQAPKDRLEDLGLSRGRLDRWVCSHPLTLPSLHSVCDHLLGISHFEWNVQISILQRLFLGPFIGMFHLT